MKGLRVTQGALDSASVAPALRIRNPQTVRIQQQLGVIRRRIGFHEQVTIYFLTRYYMAITIAAVSGLIAAGTLVMITRSGWDAAGWPLRTVFLTAAGITAFFAAFPGMFRQAENIAENAALYVAYSNLDAEIRSYMATGQDLQDSIQSADKFIHAVDRRMAQLNKIPIGFDASKLPSGTAAYQGIGGSATSAP